MRKHLGMSLVELMVSISIMLGVFLLVSNATIMSTQNLSKNNVSSDIAQQARQAMYKISDDLANADFCLAKYPTSGTASYTADNSSTLIIRVPVFTVTGDPVSGQYTVVIYRIENAVNSEDGPKVLKRYTASINGGTQSTAVLDRIILKNVKTMYNVFSTNELFFGDTWTTSFNLVAPHKGSDSRFTETVLVGGEDRLSTGKATFSTTNQITFDQAPNWQIPIDVSYQINPGELVTPEGGNYASKVTVGFSVEPQWRQMDRSTGKRLIVLHNSVQLMNR